MKREMIKITDEKKKSPDKIIWDKTRKKYMMNPDHPDYLKCTVCGGNAPSCEEYCLGCYTCNLHKHTNTCKLSRRYNAC